MTMMVARNVLRGFGRGLAWFGLALYAYAAAGLIGGAVAANARWRQPSLSEHRTVTIFVESNGVHLGIVVPKVAGGVDWRPLLSSAHIRRPEYARYDHVAIGWGDAGFYLGTPTWWDVRPGTVAAAALGSDRTLVHVDHVPTPTPGRSVRRIVLREGEYRRLAAYLRASFARGAGHRFGYGPNDAFYTGTGRYSAVRTCNAWVGHALRHAGVRVGAWTPFPATVLWWF